MRNQKEEKKIQGVDSKGFCGSSAIVLIGLIFMGITFFGGSANLFAGDYGVPLTGSQKRARLKYKKLYEKIFPENARGFSVEAVNLLGEEARIVVTGNYPVVCDYNSSLLNPPPFSVNSVPAMNHTSAPAEETIREVNGIPVCQSQVKTIKDILKEFANEVSSSNPEMSEQIPDLAIDEAKDTSLVNSFREMLKGCDIHGMSPVDRARLTDRLRDFSLLKAEIKAIMDIQASSEVEQAQQQIDLAGKLLESVHTLRLVMDSLKQVGENAGNDKKSKNGQFSNSLREDPGKYSDKYSELVSRMVLRYSISKAEPLFNRYQKLAESKISERSEDCSKSELKIKQQLGAMRTYMRATRKLYIDGGKNGRSLGARYTSYDDKYENNINAEVAFSKLSRCFKRYSSLVKDRKEEGRSGVASKQTMPAKNHPEREIQSGQNLAEIVTHSPLG